MEAVELRSPILRTLRERGFIRQATDLTGLDERCSSGPVSAYIGFDLTAPSLHVGSMIQLMVLRHLKAHGHEAFVLFGDATTRVGDPSDKNGARPILTANRIETNRVGIVQVVDRIVGACRHVHNADWLDGLSFMDFLTGPARATSLNRMLATDIVKRRIDANLPMTVMELCYSLMQGMDFAELSRRHGVQLQIGGSDQWSNILAGLDLAKQDERPVFGLTTPLMVDEHGRKMGKTAEGQAVWLSPSLVSSFDLWQFWRNVPDAKVGEFLGLFTDLPMDEVRTLAALDGAAVNDAKIVLATEAVAIAHGRDAAVAARDAAAASRSTSVQGATGLPTVTCPVDPDVTVLTVAELMVHAGIADSKAAARRLAQQRGFRFNGLVVEHVDLPIEQRDFIDGSIILSAGKKRHVAVRPSPLGRSLRPVSARVQESPDGTFEIVGTYPWGSDGSTEEDVIDSGLQSEPDARQRLARVRLRDAAQHVAAER